MDKISINRNIEYFLVEKRKGMEYTEIRKALKAKDIHEDDIRLIIRNIDNQILREMEIISQNQKAKELIGVGLFVTLVGIIFTLGTYLGMINMGDSFLVVYGPILGGLGIVYTGAKKYKKI